MQDLSWKYSLNFECILQRIFSNIYLQPAGLIGSKSPSCHIVPRRLVWCCCRQCTLLVVHCCGYDIPISYMFNCGQQRQKKIPHLLVNYLWSFCKSQTFEMYLKLGNITGWDSRSSCRERLVCVLITARRWRHWWWIIRNVTPCQFNSLPLCGSHVQVD